MLFNKRLYLSPFEAVDLLKGNHCSILIKNVQQDFEIFHLKIYKSATLQGKMVGVSIVYYNPETS